MKISAIICTHNPRMHYLRRVLQALDGQTLAKTEWELLLIDNASEQPLRPKGAANCGKVERWEGGKESKARDQRSEVGGRISEDQSWSEGKPESGDQRSEDGWQMSDAGAKHTAGREDLNLTDLKLRTAGVDLAWHANARMVREDKVGLTHARLRGIAEAKGELLVFIDDDNLLAPDYFERCWQIARDWPQLGAWGGSVAGEFEVPPPDWIKRFLPGMVVMEIDRDYWSNMAVWSAAIPFGAGMCVRIGLAHIYAEGVRKDPLRQQLGRTGSNMTASEDVDLAFTVIDQGFGTARFKDLKITHLIPKERLTEDYVVRLFSGFEVSGAAFAKARGEKRLALHGDLRSELRFWKKYLESTPIDRKIMLAARRHMKAMERERGESRVAGGG